MILESVYLNSVNNSKLLIKDMCKSIIESLIANILNTENFVSNYSSICSTLNREVRIIDTSGEWMGRAISISKSGALILESGDEVTVGDVVHLRD